MPLLPPSLAVIGLFLLAVGSSGLMTGRFAEGVQEGHPSRVLGGICVAMGFVLLGVAGWFLYGLWTRGY